MTYPDSEAAAHEGYRLADEYQAQARGEFIPQAHQSRHPYADRPELGPPPQDPGSMGQPVGLGQR